jgi:hypothetical protein
MFYYVFSVSGKWETEDDIRIVENRSEAVMFMKILRLPMKVVCK